MTGTFLRPTAKSKPAATSNPDLKKPEGEKSAPSLKPGAKSFDAFSSVLKRSVKSLQAVNVPDAGKTSAATSARSVVGGGSGSSTSTSTSRPDQSKRMLLTRK